MSSGLSRARRTLRCASYTRKSSEEGLEHAFNSLDAQREAREAFITSRWHEGWRCLPQRYDDGRLSGATMERPALQQLLADIRDGKVNVMVCYKVGRPIRSLADFAKIVEMFDARGVSPAAAVDEPRNRHVSATLKTRRRGNVAPLSTGVGGPDAAFVRSRELIPVLCGSNRPVCLRRKRIRGRGLPERRDRALRYRAL